MIKSKILPGFFFVLLLAFLGLLVGTMIGGLFVPKGSGLAGPAIALGYGFVGFVIAIVAGVLLARKLRHSQLRMALIGVGVVTLISCGWLVYRFFEVQKQREGSRSEMVGYRPVQNSAILAGAAVNRAVPGQPTFAGVPQPDGVPLGVGMVKPRLLPGAPLYFYSFPDFEKLPAEMLPSVKFPTAIHPPAGFAGGRAIACSSLILF